MKLSERMQAHLRPDVISDIAIGLEIQELVNEVAQLEAELEHVKEAHRQECVALEGQIRSYQKQLHQSQEREARLREALDNIARGMANPPDELLGQGAKALASFMWTYSQETARQALEQE